MPFVQFRVHPGVGCARMGNSENAYYLASEFPQFMQEEFPKLRLRPKPRRHPKEFFGVNETAANAPGDLADWQIFRTGPSIQNKFREDDRRIFPQAARFRVFAYVYFDEDSRHPDTVFEVTTQLADIVWKVNIANKKSKKTTVPKRDPDANLTLTSTDLDTDGAQLRCDRIRPVPGLPALAYLFLERDEADKAKVTGRLHVIGNEGDIQGTEDLGGLWNDDWYDSAGDGSVEAVIRPKNGGAELRVKAGVQNISDLKYLAYGTSEPQDGSAATIRATPGWVVVACPDYSPDMGHFVSLWDVALSRGIYNIDTRRARAQSGKHKTVVFRNELEEYLTTDYFIHIHPQLCLFEDVRWVSGQALGMPQTGPNAQDRAHNKHPGGTPPTPSGGAEAVRDARVEHGGVVINARSMKADLANPMKLKDPDPTKPIAEWLKIAIFNRLRQPATLYDKPRKFIVHPPGKPAGEVGDRRVEASYPRKLGRRMDYDKSVGAGSDKGVFYDMMTYSTVANLRKYHVLPGHGQLCGRKKSPPDAGPPGTDFPQEEINILRKLDDMYWPATFRDMPMLRDLAYTFVQYGQFDVWQAVDSVATTEPFLIDKTIHHDLRLDNIFDRIVEHGLLSSFTVGDDADKHFADFLRVRPKFAPAMIDMAHLGAMIGGSFLPGIEVGREAAIAPNWSLFHGGTKYFPDVRFKPSFDDAEHTVGTLTKDLAVPWSEDFADCDQAFWPTARPGFVSKHGTDRDLWFRTHIDSATPNFAEVKKEFVREAWKRLGFIRRTVDDKFLVAD
jgi:hypothetical protein